MRPLRRDRLRRPFCCPGGGAPYPFLRDSGPAGVPVAGDAAAAASRPAGLRRERKTGRQTSASPETPGGRPLFRCLRGDPVRYAMRPARDRQPKSAGIEYEEAFRTEPESKDSESSAGGGPATQASPATRPPSPSFLLSRRRGPLPLPPGQRAGGRSRRRRRSGSRLQACGVTTWMFSALASHTGGKLLIGRTAGCALHSAAPKPAAVVLWGPGIPPKGLPSPSWGSSAECIARVVVVFPEGKPRLYDAEAFRTEPESGFQLRKFPLREISPKASRLGQNEGGPKTDEPRLWPMAKTRLSLSWAAGGAEQQKGAPFHQL